MIRSSISGPQGELTVEHEMIPVNYLSDLDENWRFTDAAGHQHHCDYYAADHYPTLARVIDEVYWCEGCRDEHERTHLECRQCGEEVVPGTTGPGTRMIHGMTTYTLNGEPVTKERAEEIIAGWRAAR